MREGFRLAWCFSAQRQSCHVYHHSPSIQAALSSCVALVRPGILLASAPKPAQVDAVLSLHDPITSSLPEAHTLSSRSPAFLASQISERLQLDLQWNLNHPRRGRWRRQSRSATARRSTANGRRRPTRCPARGRWQTGAYRLRNTFTRAPFPPAAIPLAALLSTGLPRTPRAATPCQEILAATALLSSPRPRCPSAQRASLRSSAFHHRTQQACKLTGGLPRASSHGFHTGWILALDQRLHIAELPPEVV